MKRKTLSLETLRVESFDTTPAPACELDSPTRNCDTRQTACTIGTV